MTQSDVVSYLINTHVELKEAYEIYQNILYSIKNNKYNNLEIILNNTNNKISSYMKISVKTLKEQLLDLDNLEDSKLES